MAPTSETTRSRAQVPIVPTLFSFVGLTLLGFGTYTHLSASRPHCDGCEPWHPLFVLAPLVAGAVLAVAGLVFARR